MALSRALMLRLTVSSSSVMAARVSSVAATRRMFHCSSALLDQVAASATPKEFLESNPGSLIPDTLKDMEIDPDYQLTAAKLRELGARQATIEERKNRRRMLDSLGVPSFKEFIRTHAADFNKREVEILQVNIGLYCNQACKHCHVESSPKRKESMSREVADQVLRVLANSPSVKELDITGGAPELHEQFRYLVEGARKLGVSVIDRCNLTVLYEPGQEDLLDFLVKHKVRIVASMPCYLESNVNKQRGRGVYERSVQALLDLNKAGYGVPGTGLQLDLMYNPGGAFLPGDQTSLEGDYRRELHQRFGIVFSNLFTLTNMPIKRWADYLAKRDQLQPYMKLLVDKFNPATLNGAMCRNLVSVRYDGALFDCDFNLALDQGVTDAAKSTIFKINSVQDAVGTVIATDHHCFGCTAGAGSSCQGAVA